MSQLSPSLRLFVAIDLPKSIQNILQPMLQALPARHPILATQLHLTLNFLGELARERLEDIQKKLSQMKIQVFSLRLQGLGFFPSEQRPRVLFLGVEASPSLQKLKDLLDVALSSLGFEIDKRPFRPHLTLLRIRHSKEMIEMASWIKQYRNFQTDSFDVDCFGLFSSRLTPQGAQHHCELRVPLLR